jgi:hypothetical protein
MHATCHIRLHHTGKQVSPETRRKLAEAQRGKHHSEETRRKIGERSRVRVVSAETRAKTSATLTGRKRDLPRFQCGDCDMITISVNLMRHQDASGHSGRTPAQRERI